MKKTIIGTMLLLFIGYSSCKKQTTDTENQQVLTDAGIQNATAAPAACGTKYLNLAIDPVGFGSFLFKIENSPSNPVQTTTAIVGSAGNNQIGSSLPATTVTRMTGLSYDPASGNCFGITGSAGSHPNSLVKFNVGDPNVVSIAPLFLIGGGALNLSDIERNPFNGRFYAINRAVAANNRLVIVDVTTGGVTSLPLSTGLPLRGLAMDCGGKIYLMRMTGVSGNVYVADPGTGGIILGPCAYPGAISPGVLGANAEMGLHFDCDCTRLLVTGNFTGTTFQLTDGLPACLGLPSYAALPGSIKPTVDFSRLN